MKKNSDNPVIKRILKALGLKKLIDIARLCKISQQNLNGYIDRGTLIELVENELSERNINLDWIKTGQGNMKNGQYEMAVSPVNPVSDTNIAYQSKSNTADLVHKMRAVLGSNTVYSTALKDIIMAYYEATICQEELAEKKKALDGRPAVNGS